eukprot:CAMPEP_0201521110 /NCGR_PEP_ID=MMETSP0161_2-20130828/14213_1 /ASSEMBLY_ACC=CAM_ASM_000251 /TAXON_ID=180227 /ORGANISM="Neoparamoeba aestuarina, Strain SoJaBio B1-5/56/2" /LENGTH=103 /DNA_ID=CAMNT_0047919685 /DNA_START=44 /DNA_END=355 /DNA_ORIENTATION=+
MADAKPAAGKPADKHPADAIFDQFDKDKSGALDKKEVEAALGALAKAQGKKKPNPMMVKAAIKVMDTDGSGEVDRKEFRTLADKLIGTAKDAQTKQKKTGKPF